MSKRQAATKIQACWRAYVARLRAETAAAVVLQAVWKGRVARALFLSKRQAVICIQKRFQAKYGPILRERRAAVTLQSAWRGRFRRVQYAELRRAAIVTQKFTRGWRARKETRIARIAQKFFVMCVMNCPVLKAARALLARSDGVNTACPLFSSDAFALESAVDFNEPYLKNDVR